MRAKWVEWGTVAGGLLVFALLAWQTRLEDSAVVGFDKKVAQEAKQHAAKHLGLLRFARQATHEGGLAVMLSVGVLGSILLCICGQSRLAAIWALAAMLGWAINQAAKTYIHRDRPEDRDISVLESSSSFPSSHAMASIIGYGAFGYAGLVLLRRRLAKVVLILLVVTIVVLIGWTRIYLRAHWTSDVVGGWALGWCWLWLCIKVGGR